MRRRIQQEPEQASPPVEIRFDTVNEQVVLAVALGHPTVRHGLVRRFRESVPFVDKLHVNLWTAVLAMDRERLEFDPATVQSYAGDECADYAAELVAMRPDVPANLEHHITSLEWSIQRYSAVNGPLAELILQLRDPHTDKQAVIESAHKLATAFSNGESGAFYDTASVITQQMHDIVQRVEGRAVYPYNIDGLDVDESNEPRIIPGAAPKNITLVTGVSGSGKSTLVARIVLGQLQLGRKVAIGAWEMNPGVTIEILATLHLGFSRTAVTTGRLDADAVRELRKTMEWLREYIRFVKVPIVSEGRVIRRTNVSQVDAIMDAAEESGCEVFVADLLRKGFVSYEPDSEEQGLNHLQKRVEASSLHTIAVQQQRMKDIEQRSDKRPTREGVKGSSAWVEVSDTVLGVHRDAQWKNIEDTAIEVDILKQRYGKWPIAVRFEWDPIYATMRNGREVPYDLSLSQEVGLGGAVDKLFKGGKRR